MSAQILKHILNEMETNTTTDDCLTSEPEKKVEENDNGSDELESDKKGKRIDAFYFIAAFLQSTQSVLRC